MTRKDFELIARVIKGMSPITRDREAIAEDFANALRETNPRFNDYIFFRACGVTTGRGK